MPFRMRPFRMRKAILALEEADPLLGAVIGQVGPYRIRYLPPSFDTLVKSIVFQQLSGRVAGAIFARLREAAGGGELTPEALLRLPPARMRKLGLSRQKIAYARGIAAQALSGELDFGGLRSLSDEEAIRVLTGLKGVGEWTAHMFLIFALRRKDVLPAGDLGIQAAVKKLYGLPAMPKPRELERLGEKWRPWRTVASWYLWRTLEPDANL